MRAAKSSRASRFTRSYNAPRLSARTIDPSDIAAISDAVRALESRSCAEVVVEVRGRSGSYAHADARFGALIAFVTLLVLLFSPWPFAPIWVAIDVAVAFGIGVLLSRYSDNARRLVTSKREREKAVRVASAAAFFERGVANTSVESGLLVYLSLLEQRIEVHADRGVLGAVPALAWNEFLAAARATRASSAHALLGILRALEPLLAEHLPQREGDRDELANAPLVADE
jgi:putative membrane protein